MNVEWQEITPDEKHTWLTTGLEGEFNSFLAIGDQEAKESSLIEPKVVFKNFSGGVKTNRDSWAYNFNKNSLSNNIKRTIETFNEQVSKRQRYSDEKVKLDNFLVRDESRISWSDGLKSCVNRQLKLEYQEDHVRRSLYRPFTQSFLYFDPHLNERRYQFSIIVPTEQTEAENRFITVTNHSQLPFLAGISCYTPSLDVGGRPTQCFPFYTYSEDGTNRRENITDWALMQFRTHYSDESISKWDIFHYAYALLHHPNYRQRYAANLKRELPRIPLVPYTGEGAEPTPFNDKPADLFWLLAKAGARLAEIHVHYEDQPEYPLKEVENPDEPLNLRVEKMRLSKDKTQIKYNDFLTLTGIPPKTFNYRLGNRSALDWIIDQYQIKTDKRSGITNDPNQLENEGYIISLIKKVITVSVETVAIVEGLPAIGLPNDFESPLTTI
ncbi:MAG: hypothetical protein KME42_21785 [Tildeniella nuda ZEHNDER 1965/U140]|nr:hypothetical protein [Tildeniella nuda ZEHNDER 1965/U140]